MQKPNLDIEKECRNCFYRKTGWLCKNPQSNRFEQQVNSQETCGSFTASVAQAHFIQAFSNQIFMLNTKNLAEKERILHEVVDHYSIAIKEGLPREDEVEARIDIATTYAHVMSHRMNATRDESILDSEDMRRVLSEMRIASELEVKYDIHEIAKKWYQLSLIDTLIAYKASTIQRDDSTEASELFLRQQLEVFDHVHPTSLPTSLSLLGKFLMRQGKTEAAADCFQNILNSLARKEAASVGNASRLRHEVTALQEQLSVDATSTKIPSGITSSKTATKAGNTSSKTGCFIATAVYGSYLAPEVICLTRMRDEVLLTSVAGRCFVALYYRFSPPLAHFIAQHSRISASIRLLVVVPALRLAKLFLKQPN